MRICPSAEFRHWSWSSHGYPGAGEIDIIQTIAHEFGHLLGLGHPDCSADQAVMCPTVNSNQRTRQRQLFHFDTHCPQELEYNGSAKVATRKVKSRVFVQAGSGSFSEHVQVPTTWIKEAQ